MNWRDAPLYVRAHDLAREIHERTAGWPGRAGTLGHDVSHACRELLCAVSLALTFPEGRFDRLDEADHAVVRLRVLLRLARDLGLLSAGAMRRHGEDLDAIGRMIGGWRKREPPSEGVHP